MATQFNINTYQEQLAIPEKIQAKQVTWGVGWGVGDMEFPRILKNVEIPGVK